MSAGSRLVISVCSYSVPPFSKSYNICSKRLGTFSPLDDGLFKDFLQKSGPFGSKGKNFTQAHKEFKKESTCIHQNVPFPAKVCYKLDCGAFCKEENTRRQIDFQKELQDSRSVFVRIIVTCMGKGQNNSARYN